MPPPLPLHEVLHLCIKIIDSLSKGLVAAALGGLEVRHKFKLQYLWF